MNEDSAHPLSGSDLRLWYVLRESGEPDWDHPVDIETFSRWLAQHEDEAHIGRASLRTTTGVEVLVTTRYFGWCASTDVMNYPHVWETMIFGGEHTGYSERASQRPHAQGAHARALALVALRGRQPCWMCNGRGTVYRYVTPASAPLSAISNVSDDDLAYLRPLTTLIPCLACNGHGFLLVEPPPTPVSQATQASEETRP